MRVFVHEMRAPAVMHKVHNAYGLHPDRQNTRFLRFFALFGAQKPNSGVEIFPKKKKKFFFKFSRVADDRSTKFYDRSLFFLVLRKFTIVLRKFTIVKFRKIS